MNLQELQEIGLDAAYGMERYAKEIFFKDSAHDNALMDADDLRKEAQEIAALVKDPAISQMLNNCPLLIHAKRVDEFGIHVFRQHFEDIYSALKEFLGSKQTWEDFFHAQRSRIERIWAEPERMQREREEKKRREGEKVAKDFEENLAKARARFSKPEHEAPCFATTRKNGLNCNRNTLVEIAQCAPIRIRDRTVEVVVQRCSECWQMYKEFREVDLATKHLRNRFLKPGENDAALSLGFSNEEAKEFGKIDFGSILLPILKSGDTRPK